MRVVDVKPRARLRRALLGGSVLLYFVIALEVVIMISPFAGFFYAAFDPVLLVLARRPATQWLAAFFLPHMVLPPGLFLKAVRIAGSLLFVGGAAMFLVCAGQVYTHKLLRRGPAVGGLYAWIRHPQYLALGVTGLGLAILWPRFLTVVLWALMVAVYAVLARDEERRMVRQFGEQYRGYMARTGRFLPRSLERATRRLALPASPALRGLVAFLALLAAAVGGAFALRAYTVAHLPVWSEGRVRALAVLPGDEAMLSHRMADVLRLPAVRARLASVPGAVLVYLVPTRYVMQGMIADTGPRWRLYEHHQTLAMIADWIVHPFRHLEGGHAMMHHDMAGAAPGRGGGTVRRLIFLSVRTSTPTPAPSSLFAIGAARTPLFFADVDMHTLELANVAALGPGTGWGRVPTPMF
jgi:protein-S-isoprenylcysteine O-methyltransferase Ste14